MCVASPLLQGKNETENIQGDDNLTFCAVNVTICAKILILRWKPHNLCYTHQVLYLLSKFHIF